MKDVNGEELKVGDRVQLAPPVGFSGCQIVGFISDVIEGEACVHYTSRGTNWFLPAALIKISPAPDLATGNELKEGPDPPYGSPEWQKAYEAMGGA